jgi:fatty acid-binding protein DegV
MKTKKRKEKKTPQKMNSSLRKIINNFRAFLPTTLSQKNESKKKTLKKNIKQKKEKPCNPKKQKGMFFWTKFD